MESFLLQQDGSDLSGLGFKRERGVSISMDGTLDLFGGLHEEPQTMSGMSTNSDDEMPDYHHHIANIKRKFSEGEPVSDSLPSKMRRIERQGPDVYSVDGQQVPRLQLGESGRAQLKAAISTVLKRRPDLRKQCNAIQKVKNASIVQLLAMARICGIWDQAVRISESFLKRYPCKKESCGVQASSGRCNAASNVFPMPPAGSLHLSSLLMMSSDHGGSAAASSSGTPTLSIL